MRLFVLKLVDQLFWFESGFKELILVSFYYYLYIYIYYCNVIEQLSKNKNEWMVRNIKIYKRLVIELFKIKEY